MQTAQIIVQAAQLIILFVVPALMIFAAISDILTMTIPNFISLALAAAFALCALLLGMGVTAFVLHLGAGLLVLGVGIGLFAAGWVGGGDVKLAAASALWLGFGLLLEYLFLASIVGGLLTIAILFLRRAPIPEAARRIVWLDRLHDPKSGVPYGVALAIGGLAVITKAPLWLAAFAG